MLGTIYFKDGHTEDMDLKSFAIVDGHLYFETKDGVRYSAVTLPEVFDVYNPCTRYKLTFFRQNAEDGDWVLTDDIEKVGLKLKEDPIVI